MSMTLLIEAAKVGDTDKVQCLLDEGADVDAKDEVNSPL
jgi:ankyrin repeat protein